MRTILVPLYAHHDSGEWAELLRHYVTSRNTAINIVFNPNDGPHLTSAKEVLNFRRLRSRFLYLDVFGYIDLQHMERKNSKWVSRGSKSVKEVLQECVRYKRDYNISRFFFDDFHRGHEGTVSALELKKNQILVNPGTALRTAHKAITFESNGLPKRLRNFISLDIASPHHVVPWEDYGYFHIADDRADSPYNFLSPHMPSMLRA